MSPLVRPHRWASWGVEGQHLPPGPRSAQVADPAHLLWSREQPDSCDYWAGGRYRWWVSVDGGRGYAPLWRPTLHLKVRRKGKLENEGEGEDLTVLDEDDEWTEWGHARTEPGLISPKGGDGWIVIDISGELGWVGWFCRQRRLFWTTIFMAGSFVRGECCMMLWSTGVRRGDRWDFIVMRKTRIRKLYSISRSRSGSGWLTGWLDHPFLI